LAKEITLFGIDNIFEIIFLAGFVVGSVIRKVYTFRCRGDKTTNKCKSVVDIILISIAGVGLAAPLFYLFSPWLDFANYNLPLGGNGGFCLGPFAVVEVARRPRAQLVGDTANQAGTHTRNERRISPYSASDVCGTPVVGNCTRVLVGELARRLDTSGRFYSDVSCPGPERGTNDAR